MKYNKKLNSMCAQYKTLIEANGALTNYQRKTLLNEILEEDFNYSQKQQLILGEKEGIEFWLYAKPEFTYLQMEEMRTQLKENLNT